MVCKPWIGPLPSVASPITFISRPSVSGPTGTAIGPPVLRTSIPRTRPSVVSIAMQRTVFSPRCCATSSTRFHCSSLTPGFETRRAFRIGGKRALAKFYVDNVSKDLIDVSAC